MVTGVGTYLHGKVGDDLHLIVLDAHVDANAPDPNRCVGAAAMGLWFLSQDNLFWSRPPLDPRRITVLGCQEQPASLQGIQTVPLKSLEGAQGMQSIRQVLERLPERARILVHLDVDVICKQDMPAAYAPSDLGLALSGCQELLSEILSDARVIGLEVAEFSAVRDPGGTCARSLGEMLAESLRAAAERRGAAGISKS
jgi:arginase family enzyme